MIISFKQIKFSEGTEHVRVCVCMLVCVFVWVDVYSKAIKHFYP